MKKDQLTLGCESGQLSSFQSSKSCFSAAVVDVALRVHGV